MRRAFFSIMAVGFGLLVVFLSLVSVGQKQIVGQAGAIGGKEIEGLEKKEDETEKTLVTENEEETSESVDLEETKTNYYLPYPGILPDHPLYPLKMLRDRVRLLLTFSSDEKTELLLLYADKRVGAAWELVKGGKVDLGITTAIKAEQYLKQAMDEAMIVEDEEGRRVLVNAAIKHREVLAQIEGKIEDQGKVREAIEMNKLVMEGLE